MLQHVGHQLPCTLLISFRRISNTPDQRVSRDTAEPVYHQPASNPLDHLLLSPSASIQPRPFLYSRPRVQPRLSSSYDYSYQLPSPVPPSLSPTIPNTYLSSSYTPPTLLSGDFFTRGDHLMRQADGNNPYRVRNEEERARSRSPRRMNQVQGLHDYYPGVVPNYYPNRFVPVNQSSHPVPQAAIAQQASDGGHHSSRDLEQPDGAYQATGLLHFEHQSGNESIEAEDALRRPRSPSCATDGEPEDFEEEELQCEFAAPCRMDASPDGLHFRKVVSHVFGRNKAVTKIFPQEVWVHYCRKHYQRARYRADQWPFTQCDLLMESLRRMEEWNGVIDFELTLRRREKIRVAEASIEQPARREIPKEERRVIKATRPGRKHPTAIIAPAPDWLRGCTGEHLSFDQIREIIERIREYMITLRIREKEQQAQQDDPFKNSTSAEHRKSALAIRTQSKRQTKVHPYKLRPSPSMVRFPDIEILPNFKPWVREAALRQRSATAPPLNNGKENRNIKARVAPNQTVQPGTVVQGSQRRLQTSTLPFRSHRSSERIEARGSSPAPAAAIPRGRRGAIGRAGTNRGNSASQQRRSDRVFQQALDRMPRRGPKNGATTKKEEEKGLKEEDRPVLD
ncbi:unnamed protein product [Penicillium olsonii]|nr:unnamed protein product [Penicillium olsonii]